MLTMGKISKLKYKRYLPLLKVLKNVSDNQREVLLKHLDSESTDIICECIYNCIHSPDQIPKATRRKLKDSLPKEKQSLRYLAKKSKSNCPKKRRQHLVQSGKGIGAILGALVPIVSSLLFGK